MPLSLAQENLLYELYQVPKTNTTFWTRGIDQPGASAVDDLQINIKGHLQAAIGRINQNADQVERVGAILDEYVTVALDRSTIDREGYKLRPNKNIRAILNALYPYTGVWVQTLKQSRLALG